MVQHNTFAVCSSLCLHIRNGLSKAIRLPDVNSLITRYCPFNSTSLLQQSLLIMWALSWMKTNERPSCKSRQSCPISLQQRAVSQGKHKHLPPQNKVCQPTGLYKLATFDKTHQHKKRLRSMSKDVYTIRGDHIHEVPVWVSLGIFIIHSTLSSLYFTQVVFLWGIVIKSWKPQPLTSQQSLLSCGQPFSRHARQEMNRFLLTSWSQFTVWTHGQVYMMCR